MKSCFHNVITNKYYAVSVFISLNWNINCITNKYVLLPYFINKHETVI